MLHGHSERACILVDFQATLMMQALDCMCKWDRLGQLDDLNVMAYKEMSATTGSPFGICHLSPGLQSFGLQPLPPHGQSPAELLTCNKRNVVEWNGGKIYIYIFNNYMEKVGGWEKQSWCWSFSPVSRSFEGSQGPGWSRIVWPTSLSDYPFSLLAIGKGTPWNWSNILNNQGHLTIRLSWTTNSVGL